jgi:hypothetical protein
MVKFIHGDGKQKLLLSHTCWNKIENARTHILAHNWKIKKGRRKNQTEFEALFLLPSFTLPPMVDPSSLWWKQAWSVSKYMVAEQMNVLSVEVERVAPPCALVICPTWTSFMYSSCLQSVACRSSMVPRPPISFAGTRSRVPPQRSRWHLQRWWYSSSRDDVHGLFHRALLHKSTNNSPGVSFRKKNAQRKYMEGQEL